MQKSEIIAGLKELQTTHLNLATYAERAIAMLEGPDEAEYIQGKPPRLNIGAVLREISVPTHVRGYKFLKDAIEAVMENPGIMRAMTKELYPAVANLNGTTPQRVERAIRTAIELAWDKEDNASMKRYFPSWKPETERDPLNWRDGRKPTCGEFISTLAEVLGLEKAS
jgi:two-component system response regulator (stage 0 sporulation protein A)